MITKDDQRWLDAAYLQAIVNAYTPWITNARLPAHERRYAEQRVTACRAELARTQETMPLPVLVVTGGARA